jgi:hypothetical protein
MAELRAEISENLEILSVEKNGVSNNEKNEGTIERIVD